MEYLNKNIEIRNKIKNFIVNLFHKMLEQMSKQYCNRPMRLSGNYQKIKKCLHKIFPNEALSN